MKRVLIIVVQNTLHKGNPNGYVLSKELVEKSRKMDTYLALVQNGQVVELLRINSDGRFSVQTTYTTESGKTFTRWNPIGDLTSIPVNTFGEIIVPEGMRYKKIKEILISESI